MNTKKEIVDRTYFILGEDQSSTVFDKEGEVVPKINEIIDKICRCNVTNILTGTKIRGGILDFLYEDRTLTIPSTKRLMEEIDVNTKYVLLDNINGLEARGKLEIEGNIISYNGLDVEDNAILNVAGINGKHGINALVHYAYLLPDNIIKTSDFYDVEYGETLNFIDFREPRNQYARCYTLKPDKGRKVAIFYNIDSNVMIAYTKKLDPMVSDEDECGLPDDYGLKILPCLAVGELLIDTSESNKGRELLAIGYGELEDMYTYYATPMKKFRKKIKTTPLVTNLW